MLCNEDRFTTMPRAIRKDRMPNVNVNHATHTYVHRYTYGYIYKIDKPKNIEISKLKYDQIDIYALFKKIFSLELCNQSTFILYLFLTFLPNKL